MEDWQRAHIKNLVWDLVQQTLCNVYLLTRLEAAGILSCNERHHIDYITKKHKKAQILYELLLTKPGGYYALTKALKETSQRWPATVLLTNETFSRLKVKLSGHLYTFGEVLYLSTIEAILWLDTNLPHKQRLDILYNSLQEDHSPQLHDKTVPPNDLYIPRFLTQRVVVNPAFFKEECPDVFVFKHVQRTKLRNYITENIMELSIKEFLRVHVETRFILMDFDRTDTDWASDWSKICDKAIGLVHLIRYEHSTETFLLEATNGSLNRFGHYINDENEHLETITFSENRFVECVLKSNIQCICICDMPGIGKSFLLKSLARTFCAKFPDKLVGFVSLNKLMPKELSTGELIAYQKAVNLAQILAFSFARRVHFENIKNENITLELFIDGLEEVPTTQTNFAMLLLREIVKTMPFVRIYLTSNPTLRNKLNEILDCIYFEIQTFNEENQLEFLTKYCANGNHLLDLPKLQENGRVFLKSLKKSIPEDETRLFGVPLQCKLIAGFYAEEAAIHAGQRQAIFETKTTTYLKTVMEIYSRLTSQRLGEAKCGFLCLYNRNVNAMQCDGLCQIRNYHIWLAIETVFPDFAKHLSKIVVTFENLSQQTILTRGLIKHQNSGKPEFLYYKFAEYLVAEYFLAIFTRHKTGFLQEMEQLAFNEIFAFTKCTKVSSKFGYALRENFVAHFLNELLGKSSNDITLSKAKIPISSFHFLTPLEVCLYCNYEALLNVVYAATENSNEHDLEYHRKFLEEYKDAAASVLKMAFTHCKAITVEKLCKYFSDAFSFDLFQIGLEIEGSNSPVNAAIRRADAEIVLLFVKRMSLENRGLLYTCLEDTYFDGDDLLEKRLGICQLLLSKCPTLLTESWKDFANPLHANGIHFKAIEFLVNKGSDFFVLNNQGQSVLHLAANYMSVNEIWDLSKFLYQHCVKANCFLKPPNMRKYFYKFEDNKIKFTNATILGILRLVDLETFSECQMSITNGKHSKKDVCDILEPFLKTVLQPNYNEGSASLLQLAISKGIVEVANLLLAIDGSLLERDHNGGPPPIFVAVLNRRIKIIKCLVKKGVNLLALNSNNETLLHVAAKTEDCYWFRRILSLLGQRLESIDIKNVANNFSGHLTTKPNNVVDLFNWAEKERNGTPLHYAVYFMDLPVEILDMFVLYGKTPEIKPLAKKHNININAKDLQGKTALYYALERNRNIGLAKRLVELGADWKIKNEFGCNIAHICAQYHLREHLQYFLDLGCDVNEIDSQGNNALQCTFNCLYEEDSGVDLSKTIQILFSAGVNIQNRNHHGNTAHDIALRRQFPEEILKLLM